MNYYSQHGEDKWIVENLKLPEKGVFVEVGAFDGVLSSNTLHFEEKGWTGLLVEPDPFNYAKCAFNRRNPVFACAVGIQDGLHDFHINLDDRGLSGLNRNGIIFKVEVRHLVDLLIVAGINDIDLLSIDTEGTELEVWQSLGIRRQLNPAKIVVIEHNTLGLPVQDELILNEMSKWAYKLVHKTACNMIFVNNQ